MNLNADTEKIKATPCFHHTDFERRITTVENTIQKAIGLLIGTLLTSVGTLLIALCSIVWFMVLK